MLESKIQHKIVAYLKSINYITRKLDASSQVGWPDLIAISPLGVVYFFEVKTETGRLSKLQDRTINQLKENNANAYVVRSAAEVAAIIRETTQRG
jgi:Holliday junction resolvase-like predicted endonuclease